MRRAEIGAIAGVLGSRVVAALILPAAAMWWRGWAARTRRSGPR